MKREDVFDTVVRASLLDGLIFEEIIELYEITSHAELAKRFLHDFVNTAKLNSLQLMQEAKNTQGTHPILKI